MKQSALFKHWALFLTFLKASTFTFAGGLAIVPAIEQDAVHKYGLLDKEEFMEYATLSQTIPGVITINFAALVGRRVTGFTGMLAAGFGAILPAFSLMIVATVLAGMLPQEGRILGAMRGVRAASAAMVLAAAFSLGQHNLKSTFAIIVMIAAFALAVTKLASAPIIVVLAGLAGCVWQLIRNRRNRRSDDVD